MKKPKLVLVLHDIRSTLNVGSLLRTADGLGVDELYLTGYTPYPEVKGDVRLPHIRAKLDRQIHKTALGAENSVVWSHQSNISKLLTDLKERGFLIAALEQTDKSKSLPGYKSDRDIAVIAGNEIDGLDNDVLRQADVCLEIPMLGKKESLNVAVAAAIAVYHLKYPS